jgi:hypothetical protein
VSTIRPGAVATYPTPFGPARVDRHVDEVTWAAVVEALRDTNLTPSDVLEARVTRHYVALTWMDRGTRRTIHATRR